jgi:hypothetical protein
MHGLVTGFGRSVGQLAVAIATWWARRRSIASPLRRLPVMVGNSGSLAAPGHSLSHACKIALVSATSGVRRSFLPLPMVCTLALSS